MKNPLDDFYKTDRATIHAKIGSIVAQNPDPDIIELNVTKSGYT